MLPESLRAELGDKTLLDFGLGIEPGRFEFNDTYCLAPTSLVLAYALAVATSGKTSRILMAGFDGYPAGDKRNDETAAVLDAYEAHSERALVSITPTLHRLNPVSIYGSEI